MTKKTSGFGPLKIIRTILDVFWAGSLLVLIIGAIYLVLSFAIPGTVSPNLIPAMLPVEMNLSEFKQADGSQVFPLVERISGLASFTIPDSHSRLNSVGLLAQMIPFIVGFFILHQVFAAVKVALQKHPFSFEVVKHLRFAAYGLLVYGPVSWVSYFSATQYILWKLGYAGTTLVSVGDVNLIRNILVGLGVLVIASIFQAGIEMKQEKDLTI